MKGLEKEYGDTDAGLRMLGFFIVVVSLLIFAVVLNGTDASAQGELAMIAPAGSISTRDGSVIPPFPTTGGWTELQGKSSDRYETRHFMYMVPSEPPAMELYVAADKRHEPPDAAFEMGLVRGYLTGFSGKAGFTPGSPVFQRRQIGSCQALCSTVQLSKGNRTIWFYAYIYPREPSLTFLTIRAEQDAGSSIETYLSGLHLK